MDGRGGHSLANVQGQPCRSITPKNMKKIEKGLSRGFESVWMCVCPFVFGVKAVWSVFRFISMARLAADFTDLLRLEVG